MVDREGIPYTRIEANITKYLFVPVPCPHCEKEIAISLGSLYKKAPLRCTECGGRMTLFLGSNRLNNFVVSFDQLYAQLQKIGLPLMFFHHPPW